MRRFPRGVPAAALAAVLALGSATAVHAAPPPTTKPPAPPADGVTRTVTLITGDTVTVTTTGGRTLTSVRPAPGSSGGFQTMTVGGSVYVIPDDARPLLAADRLDRELFNVTDLVAFGYTDRRGLPLIVSYGAARGARQALRGAVKKRDLNSINATAVQVSAGEAAAFWKALAPAPARTRDALGGGVAKVWLDGKVRAADDVSTPQVGAPEAWKQGYKGTGATVAVLDSGVDETHPDLADRVGDKVSFVPGETTADRHGHGTHVASTVAGTGAASEGRHAGVAPGAKVVVGKVLGDDGSGQNSWIIAGMEWAASKARVVNMSLGDPSVTHADDPMAQAVDRISASTGALFVIAAGNTGDEGTVSSPGTADSALTVGAVDRDDQRAWFSSMGPRGGDGGMKPDLAAPGVDILAARSKDSRGSGSYVAMSGTSMATPHVAGAAAILAQKHPDWKAPELKAALMSGSKVLKGTTPYQLGAGRLWVPGALGTVRATGSENLGFYSWPHDGDAPVTRTITYTNDGDRALDLRLTAESDAAGLFRLSADRVTVPAHGTAKVTVTADADDAKGTGQFGGQVVAADDAGQTVAHTALGLVKEGERYDLDLKLVGRDGKPAGGTLTVYRYGDQVMRNLPVDPSTGTAAGQRLEPGVYTVTGFVGVDGGSGVALVGTPHLKLDRDTALTLDAREAVKISVRVPERTVADHRRVQWFHDSGIGGRYATFSASYSPPPNLDDLYAVPTGTVGGERYDFAVRWRLAKPYLSVAATRVGGLDPRYLQGSRRLDGRVDLPVAHAGTGTAAEYENVPKGAAVVIDRSDAVTADEAVAAAQRAGAALLLVANDRPGRFNGVVGSDLPVAALTKAEGARLAEALKRGKVRLTGSATEFSPVKYDLSKSYPGAIPGDLSWRPRRLARVDERFAGARETVAFDNRYDCRDYQWPPCLGFYDPQGLGRARVSHVSTEANVGWYQMALTSGGWEQRHDQVTYRPGQRASMDWFGPVTRPRLGPGYWGPHRKGDFFQVNVPTDGGPDTTGGDDTTAIKSRLYQNGKLVAQIDSQAIQREVPHVDGKAAYRFEQDTANPSRRLSTATRNAWTFASTTPAEGVDELLPLLQIGYDVDTDLSGDAKANRRAPIRLTTWHQPDAVGTGKPAKATLEVSYDDGATWQKVTLRRDGSSWKGTLAHPRDGFVSLRATAEDTAGNTARQEVIRAYGLR